MPEEGAAEEPETATQDSDTPKSSVRPLVAAAIGPALALVGVAAGIFVGVFQDAADRERADRIRVAELVLPSYQEVIQTVTDVNYAVYRCAQEVDLAWSGVLGELSEQGVDPEDAPNRLGPADVQVGQEIKRLCLDVATDTSRAADVAIAQALTVSDDSLEGVAADYAATKDEMIDELLTGLMYAESREEVLNSLERLSVIEDTLISQTDDLIDAVRQQALFLGGDLRP